MSPKIHVQLAQKNPHIKNLPSSIVLVFLIISKDHTIEHININIFIIFKVKTLRFHLANQGITLEE
jgi:hypothetical protein